MWKKWKYKNITLLICAFIFSIFLGSFPPFKEFIFSHGIAVAFLAGAIFISTFTCPIACAMLLVLAQKYPLPEIWIVASVGAVLSDFIFFNMVRDHIGDEVQPLIEEVVGKSDFDDLLDTENFRWLLPVIGAGIILTPLPKTMGLNLMGIKKLKHMQFVALSAAVNTVGIAGILLLSFVIKP